MNCLEAEKLIYLYTELTPDERRKADRHLKECQECREKMERTAMGRSLAATTPAVQLGQRHATRLTSQIMNAVQQRGTRRAFPYLKPVRAQNKSLHYAMATLSLLLVTTFFIQYSETPRLPATHTAIHSLRGERIDLNTALFHEALVAAKKNGTGRTGLYECVVSCLQAHDANCDQCATGFAKPK